MGIQLTDFKLLVWGMQGVTERVELNNLGLLFSHGLMDDKIFVVLIFTNGS